MKRILSVILAAAFIVTALMGCGKKETETTNDNISDTVKNAYNDAIQKTEAYNVDLAEYLTIADYKNIVVDTAADEYKKHYDSLFENDVANNSLYDHVVEGEVASGDIANITFAGKLKGETKYFTGDTTKEDNDGKQSYDLVIGSGSFIPGFEDKLIGVAYGGNITFDITFPSNYGTADLAGKLTTFEVTVNYKNVLPQINDGLAAKLNFASAGEYEAELKEKAVQNYIYDKIINESTVDKLSPDDETFYNTTYDNYVAYSDSQIEAYKQYTGQDISSDDMLYQMSGMNKAQLKEYFVSQQKAEMVLYYIYKKENLKYDLETYNDVINSIIKSNSSGSSVPTAEDIINNYDKRAIETSAVSNYVIKYLADTVTVK